MKLASMLAVALVATFADAGAARAECETSASRIPVSQGASAPPSAGRLSMMLVKSRGLVAETPRAPAARPRKAAPHRAKPHRKAKTAAAKSSRRHAAAAPRPHRKAPPRSVPAPPKALAAGPAPAPSYADIRTEVCTSGETPLMAMLARLGAPPETLESKVTDEVPLDTEVPGPGGGIGGGTATPATGGPGTTFLPPMTPPVVGPVDTDPPQVEPPFPPPTVTPPTTDNPPVLTPVVSPEPQPGRPTPPTPPATVSPPTTLLPPIISPQTPLEPRPPPLAPVPEPGVWALLIAGFGFVGARLRAAARRAARA